METEVIRGAQLTWLQISWLVLQKLDMNGAARPCANKLYCSSYLVARAISLSNPNADCDYYDLPIAYFECDSRSLTFYVSGLWLSRSESLSVYDGELSGVKFQFVYETWNFPKISLFQGKYKKVIGLQ